MKRYRTNDKKSGAISGEYESIMSVHRLFDRMGNDASALGFVLILPGESSMDAEIGERMGGEIHRRNQSIKYYFKLFDSDISKSQIAVNFFIQKHDLWRYQESITSFCREVVSPPFTPTKRPYPRRRNSPFGTDLNRVVLKYRRKIRFVATRARNLPTARR